ncbi:ATP-binding protein [Bacillus cereus]|uniref:ATP-binding protein n=1 Tax=Bacillus cereus TaxID=1396 RepID=UPI000B59ECF0|nr:ATP-binding protein [Bacillus cereus]
MATPMKKLAESLESKVNYHSDQCMNHSYVIGGQTIIKPVQMIIYQGKPVCPRCVVEQNNKVLEEQANAHYKKISRLQKFNMLEKASVITNKKIPLSRLSDYRTVCNETISHKKAVEETLEDLKKGEIRKVVFTGNQGTAKSFLSYSMLHELNQYFWDISQEEENYHLMKSCLYVELEAITRMIMDSFDDKSSKYTLQYFVQLIGQADFVVLDDLGAESGSTDSNRQASDFIQRLLYAVSNARQGMSTFTTTNFTGKQLFNKYDTKTVSRLLGDSRVLKFTTADQRLTNLAF